MADGAGGRGGRCVHRADGRTGTNEADERTGGRADGAERARTVGRMGAERVRTIERTGGRGPRGVDTRTDRRGVDGAQHVRTGGRANGRTSGRGDRRTGRSGPPLREQWVGRTGVLAVRRSSGWADKRTDGRAGGPGFKMPNSTRLGSLLGAQSACLVKARVRRVPGSALGSSTIPRQTPVLSAQTHLPCLSASVLGAKKGILLFRYKNGFTQGRWQRDAKSMASSLCTKGRGWRRGQEKAKSGGLGARHVAQPGAACIPGMGAAAAAMVSSHGHEVCRIPPLRTLVATHFIRTALQIEGCKILAS